MTLPATDMWQGAPVVLDEGQCPVCQCDSCEDPTHTPFDPDTDSGPSEGEASEPSTSPVVQFQTAADVMRTPRPAPIIAGMVWADKVTVLVGESGAGKTFLLLGASAAVSDGVAWLGRPARHGSVAYLSFEGDALGLRLRALASLGHELEHVHILRATTPLSPVSSRDGQETPSLGETIVAEELEALVAKLEQASKPEVVLLVVDTVRASMSGSEDSSEHVSAYLRAIRRLLGRVPGAGAVIVHHAGWLDAAGPKRKRERGSSAFRGNCDATLYLEPDGEDAGQGELNGAPLAPGPDEYEENQDAEGELGHVPAPEHFPVHLAGGAAEGSFALLIRNGLKAFR